MENIIYKKFVNNLMKQGKKFKVEKILKKACIYIKTKQEKNVTQFLNKAVNNVKPLIQPSGSSGSSRGGRRKKIKIIPIKINKGLTLATKWIIQGAKKRPENTMALRLYLELVAAYNKKGYAIKKKEELHNTVKVSFFQTKTS